MRLRPAVRHRKSGDRRRLRARGPYEILTSEHPTRPTATWDQTDDRGERVAASVYFIEAIGTGGQRGRGEVVVLE